MTNTRPLRVARRRGRAGAVSVEYVVLLVIFAGVAVASAALGVVLARSAQRADVILRSNSP